MEENEVTTSPPDVGNILMWVAILGIILFAFAALAAWVFFK